jgi:colanic acid biosynthesis glycosyl transferase WcaI
MGAVVFINRYFYPDHSAASQLLSDLAFYLAKQNFDVTVVTSRQIYDDPLNELPSEEIINGVRINRLRTSRFGRQRLWGRALDYLTFYFSAIGYLLKTVRKADIVIAKTDPPLISVLAALITKLRNAVFINWIQDLFPEVAITLGVKGVNIVEPLLRYIRNYSLRAAKYNVVLGDRMAQRLISEGVMPNKIKMIHNWSDGDQIKPVESHENELRYAWDLQNRFVVGYSGNMGRAHEFGTIIDTIELLKETPNIVFLFIGDGAQRAWIGQEADKRGLKNIIFKPYQPREQLSLSLTVPDVHLISLQPQLEGLIVPSKFYGIAAAGRPMIYIGDSEGEIPRILREGGCGYTVDIGSAGDLANHIKNMSLKPVESQDMGRRSRCVFEKRFDKMLAMNEWKMLITESVSGVKNTLQYAEQKVRKSKIS